MNTQYILKGYFMSDIDFEALGRCEHLKEKLRTAGHSRDMAFNEVKRSYRESTGYDWERTVNHVDISVMRSAVDRLESADNELMALVQEFNEWAPKAGKKQITILKR